MALPLMLERYTFLNGFGALFIAAPAIVRVENIMPVRALPPELLAPPNLQERAIPTIRAHDRKRQPGRIEAREKLEGARRSPVAVNILDAGSPPDDSL